MTAEKLKKANDLAKIIANRKEVYRKILNDEDYSFVIGLRYGHSNRDISVNLNGLLTDSDWLFIKALIERKSRESLYKLEKEFNNL